MTRPDIMSNTGLIIACHGRHYLVETGEPSPRRAFPRAKRSEFACGDRVELSADGHITASTTRTSLLYRSDAYRQKLIAANATQLVLVVATVPSFSPELLSRALVAAEAEGLQSLIVLNKADLEQSLATARASLAPFAKLGYRIIELSAQIDVTPLQPELVGHLSVLVGQSGMGKSTLTNALVPAAQAQTREISTALDSGKHTTTSPRLYHLPAAAGSLIDCPGLQEFGLAHLERGAIEHGFVEFRSLLGTCRYRDCRHDREPGCAIKSAVAAGLIHQMRLQHFHSMIGSLG